MSVGTPRPNSPSRARRRHPNTRLALTALRRAGAGQGPRHAQHGGVDSGGHLRHPHTRNKRLLDDPGLLVVRPLTPTLDPAQNLDPHRPDDL